VPYDVYYGKPAEALDMSKVGKSALLDTKAFMRLLEQEAAKYIPPASPMEEWLRNGPPPITVVYGADVPGQLVPGPMTRRSSSASYGGATRGPGGGGGAGHWQGQQAAETAEQGAPEWRGRVYQTPFGPMGQLPDPDMLRWERGQQARQAGLAALLEGAKGFAPALQTQGAMTDAQLRMMMEMGPLSQAKQIYAAAYARGAEKHGDLAKAGRDATAETEAFLKQPSNALPPFMRGFFPGLTPDQAMEKMMPPAQPGGAGNQQPANRPPEEEAGFTSDALAKFLQQAGVLNDKGQAVSDINADKLAEALYGNPEMMRRGSPGLARAMLDAGIAPDRVVKAMQLALIRRHSAINAFNPAGRKEGTYGPYRVKENNAYGAGMIDTSRPILFDTAPGGDMPGYAIEGPGGGVWHSAGNYVVSPFRPWLPNFTDVGRAESRGQAEALASLLAAIEAERGRRAAAQAGR
jgi:hypothetical protein